MTVGQKRLNSCGLSVSIEFIEQAFE